MWGVAPRVQPSWSGVSWMGIRPKLQVHDLDFEFRVSDSRSGVRGVSATEEKQC